MSRNDLITEAKNWTEEQLPAVKVDEAGLAELLTKHRQAVPEWAEDDGCLCRVDLQSEDGLKPGPDEVAQHIASVIAEWLQSNNRR